MSNPASWSDQWEFASDGVWLVLTHHLFHSFIKLFEGIRVQVAASVCVDACMHVHVFVCVVCLYTVSFLQVNVLCMMFVCVESSV